MSELIRELGKVKDVDLFIEDHGILTLFIYLDFGITSQGFGGYHLGSENQKGASGIDFVWQILTLFGVVRLKEAIGKPVYVIREESYGKIIGLETPPFDGGKSFFIKDWQAKWRPEKFS